MKLNNLKLLAALVPAVLVLSIATVWAGSTAPLSIEEFNKLPPAEGKEYQVRGYVVEIFKCPPCPPEAVCSSCPGESLLLSDGQVKGQSEEEKRREVLVTLFRLNATPEFAANPVIKEGALYSVILFWDGSMADVVGMEEIE